jgi:hypothetical protein
MIDSGHGMLDQVRQAVVRRGEHLRHDVERRHFLPPGFHALPNRFRTKNGLINSISKSKSTFSKYGREQI